MDLQQLKSLSQQDAFKWAAEFSGVPADVLDGLWATESQRGQKMLSPAGARGHFQLMPKTQALFEARLGVQINPDDFHESLFLAAHHLRDDMQRENGDVVSALRAYNNGPKWRSQKDPRGENAAYAQKVLAAAGRDPVSVSAETMTAHVNKLRNASGGRTESLTTPLNAFVDADAAAQQADYIRKGNQTFGDTLAEKWGDPRANLLQWLADRSAAPATNMEFDYYGWDGRSALEKEAQNEGELRFLRENVTSPERGPWALQQLQEYRRKDAVYRDAGDLDNLGAEALVGLADPVGWIIGGAASKTFGLSRAALRAYSLTSGATRAGVAGRVAGSALAEGVVGNMGWEAVGDLTGQVKSVEDYALAGAFGAGFTAPFLPSAIRRAIDEVSPSATAHVEAFRLYEQERLQSLDAASRKVDTAAQMAEVNRVVDAGRYAGTDRRAESKVIPDELIARSVDDEPLLTPEMLEQPKAPDAPAAPPAPEAATPAAATTYVTPSSAGEAPTKAVAMKIEDIEARLAEIDARRDEIQMARQSLLQSNGSRPRTGTKARKQFDELTQEMADLLAERAPLWDQKEAMINGKLEGPGQDARPEFVKGATQRVEDILREGLQSEAASPIKAADASMVRTLVGRLLDVLPDTVKNYQFDFNKAIGTRLDTGESGLRERGAWNPATKDGTIPGESARALPARDVRGRNPLGVAVHEIVHAATSRIILAIQYNKPGIPEKAKKAYARLEELRGELKAELQARGLYVEGKEVGANYATKNADEFVAQAMSDRETIEVLESMPGRQYETENAHETFWKQLLRMMGLDRPRSNRPPVTAAEEAGQLVEALIRYQQYVPEDMSLHWEATDRWGTRPGYAKGLFGPGVESAGAKAQRDSHFFAQLYAHAEAWGAANPVDQNKLTTLANEYTKGAVRDTAVSDGLKLASSNNAILRMVSGLITEVTTGAAGRRTTADLLNHMYHNRIIGNSVNLYDSARTAWAKKNGGGWLERFQSGKVDAKFDRLVYEEILQRRYGIAKPMDAEVVAAAGALQALFQRSLDQQKRSGTLGSAWLPDDAVGYIPQSLNGDALRQLDPVERQQLQSKLAEHWATHYKWGTEFASEFAHKYLVRAQHRAAGERNVDHVATQGATHAVQDVLSEMRLEMRSLDARTAAELERVGAAPYAKHRLDLPLLDTLPNGKRLLDYFSTDSLTMARAHARTVAGHAALAEHNIMGQRGVNNLLRAVREAPVGQEATPDEIAAAERTFATFLGQPWHGEHRNRLASGLAAFTRLRLMGGLAFTQLGEMVNGLHIAGLSSTLEALGSLPRMIGEVRTANKGGTLANAWLGTIDRFSGYELGTEQYRMATAFDPPDELLRQYGKGDNVVERALQSGNYLQAKISFFRGLHAAQHRAFAEQIVIKAVDYLSDPNKAGDRYLEDMGFNAKMRKALRDRLSDAVQRDAAGNAVGFDLYALGNTDLMEDFVAAVHRGTSQIIQGTFIGEKGAWAHSDLQKLALQLRTFGITSMEKQWARNRMLAGPGLEGYAYAGGVLLAQMAFVLPIYLARLQVNAVGREDREDYIANGLAPAAMVQAMMNYSSAGGLAGDAFDIVASLAGGWNDDAKSALGTRSFSNGVGGLVPGLGTVDQGLRVVRGDGDLPTAIKMLPFSNLPYVQGVINATR